MSPALSVTKDVVATVISHGSRPPTVPPEGFRIEKSRIQALDS